MKQSSCLAWEIFGIMTHRIENKHQSLKQGNKINKKIVDSQKEIDYTSSKEIIIEVKFSN